MEKRITKNALETQILGKEIGESLKGGEILALYGDLGSGKTTFVQGLALGLKISQRIISPTFLILRSYDINGQESIATTFYHVDLYRTQGIRDMEGLGLEELMNDQSSIVVIEWPERIGDMLPKQTRKIMFRYISEEEREIRYE